MHFNKILLGLGLVAGDDDDDIDAEDDDPFEIPESSAAIFIAAGDACFFGAEGVDEDEDDDVDGNVEDDDVGGKPCVKDVLVLLLARGTSCGLTGLWVLSSVHACKQ